MNACRGLDVIRAHSADSRPGDVIIQLANLPKSAKFTSTALDAVQNPLDTVR